MMRNLGSFAARLPFALLALVGCAEQEPAAAPLAAPPPAAAPAPPPAPVEAKKEEPKPVPLTAEQKLKAYQEGWAAFDAKDFAKFQGIWAENATSEMLDMGAPLTGPAAITEKGAKSFASGFPDATGELQLTLVNGNNIVGVVLVRGTNAGTYVTPVGPVPATNKKVGFLAAQSVEVNDQGKAVKEVLAYDGGTVAGQLGLMPMPHRKAIETGWTEKPVVIASGSETEKTNLAAFSKGIEGFNKHDAAAALAAAADDVVFSKQSGPADLTGKKEVQKGLEESFKAFPDVKLDVKSSWAAGDYVVSTGTWSGTNTGDMPSMKMKKTGKPVSVHYIQIDKFVGGKTKNMWLFMNGAAAAAQLGMLPPMKAGEAPGKEGKGTVGKAPESSAKPAGTPATKAEPAAKPAAAAAPAAKPAAAAPAPAAAAKPAAPAPAAKPAPAAPAPKPAPAK
ncbi:MAG TPA: nuclear transport factor 2 family protein [Polyangiaceae bacterium]|nr:nuclear transport factor 2 family protein [Polyangiaceae bacterium]